MNERAVVVWTKIIARIVPKEAETLIETDGPPASVDAGDNLTRHELLQPLPERGDCIVTVDDAAARATHISHRDLSSTTNVDLSLLVALSF
eukprot:CAMPEP_0119311766 /NCGR_PEP_ID=MMETSP1333-20130426/23799_1 /TAXON_ID=418940 /ORGANISM="Scyphosphaera apsteinii, Strain RCC1455" /LENGTH=90 /DNA_ID=CAMNT_0007316235 /DNA_START=517 /DNA_END=789 /DNA_ORIENTATION=-